MTAAVSKAADRMDHHEKMQIRAAAFRATRLFPGAIGTVLSRELLTWEEFGFRLGNDSTVRELVDQLLKMPTPPPAPDPPPTPPRPRIHGRVAAP